MPRNPPEKTARPAARRAGRRGEFPPISVQVYRQLRNAIIQGKINPGERLSELEIAVQYETSRQPVREAFIKLAEECLVRILPQRGTFVVKISVAEVMDARFVREAIEIAVVMKAAASASLSAIQALRVLIEKQAAIQAGHNIEFYALDDEFHRALALSAGHAYAWRVLESIKAQMDRVRYLSLDDATPIPLLIEQHRRIVDGIEAGDPTVAAAAMRNHLREITLSLPAIAGHFPELFQAD